MSSFRAACVCDIGVAVGAMLAAPPGTAWSYMSRYKHWCRRILTSGIPLFLSGVPLRCRSCLANAVKRRLNNSLGLQVCYELGSCEIHETAIKVIIVENLW